jgi:ABC-type bacteriocin/lantibiotic exporter with double-glycine peptidase domain
MTFTQNYLHPLLLGLVLALLPVILTTAFPHLIVISIYAGTLPWLALGWAVLVMTIIMRRQRIAEWREKRKLNKKKRTK